MKSTGKELPVPQRTLTGDDYKTIAGIVIAIVTLAVGPLYLFLNSLTNRMQRVEERLTTIEVTLGRIDERLMSIERSTAGSGNSGFLGGSFPPPSASVLYMVLSGVNSPLSAYLADQGEWSGAWPELAHLWNRELGLADVEFVASPPVTNTVALTNRYDYLTAIFNRRDPAFDGLVAQGWSEQSMDPYFARADYGPFGYSILVSPRVVEAGYLPTFLLALDRLPPSTWSELGKLIQGTPSP